MLISIDTLRADHLSLYGYSRPTSPYLEELAQEAVVFDTFVTNGGFTLPSHMTMMTSLRPNVHGVIPRQNERLPESRTTLSEVFHRAGYRTGAFVDGGWLRGNFGFRQGFDVYFDAGGRFKEILPRAYRWLERNHAEPFFLFLHTFDVHSQWGGLPYNCPAPYPELYSGEYSVDFDGCRENRCASRLLKWIVDETKAGKLTPTDVLTPTEIEFTAALYDGCINYVDAKIREIIERLRSYGILDRTLVVITSDHGEEFLEHGLLIHAQRGFEELVHVPLIMRFPNGRFGGRRVPHLAAMIDLMPTILEGVGLSSSPESQGRSLMPAVVAGRRVRGEATIWEALRTERWKYLPETETLFDLANDAEERNNVWNDEPETVRRLAAIRDRYAARDRRLVAILQEPDAPSGPLDLSEEEIRELKALGYLD